MTAASRGIHGMVHCLVNAWSASWAPCRERHLPVVHLLEGKVAIEARFEFDRGIEYHIPNNNPRRAQEAEIRSASCIRL